MQLSKKELKQLSKNQLIEIILNQEERIARLEKNSQNSSKPPSSDNNKPKPNQSLREKSSKKPGGQKGHAGKTREQVENPDKIETCLPDSKCKKCGAELDFEQVKLLEKRQEVEIPEIKPTVTEYQKIGIRCECGYCNEGKFPEQIKAAMQIGPKTKSFLIYLNVVQLIPYKRLTELIKDLFDFPICKRTIENSLEEATKNSEPLYEFIMQIIKNSEWVGSDETSKKVNGDKWWEWVWQNSLASYYAIEDGRGYDVVKKHFGEDYKGTLVHDCWPAHNNTVAKTGHQQCHPHIQRALQFLIETYKSKWAYDLSAFLKAAQKARDKIWADDFDETIRAKIILKYQEKLKIFLVRNSQQKDILRLQKRIIKHQTSILHFMTDKYIPFHNNSSERAIRMAKVKQKISGGFRSERGAQRHSILLSIIETAKKQKLNLLNSIQLLLSNKLVFLGC